MKNNHTNKKEFSVLIPIFISSLLTLFASLILVYTTSITNIKIEKSKEKDSFISEFNKIKAQKIGETWEVLNVWEAQIAEYLDLYKQIKDKNFTDVKEAKSTLKRFKELKNVVYADTEKYKIELNRFWIGEEQYQLMGDFSWLIARKLELYYQHFDPDSLKNIDRLINAKRVKLDSIIIKMLKE